MVYNEPTKEGIMTNPKLKAFAIKAGLSAIFALLIGYTAKAELKIADKVDEKYAEKEESTDSTS